MKNIYMDNASTTKPFPEVVEYIKEILDNKWQNPNSNYESGHDVRKIIETTRKKVAEFINAEPEEIFFTSGGSAANTLCIQGYVESHFLPYFLTSRIEHSSINAMPNKVGLPCDINGVVVPMIDRTRLVSIMGANNEIGTIEPIKEYAEKTHEYGGIFHSDLTQLIPSQKIDVKELGLDMASFSGHKIHALKGTGVAYIKKGIEVKPLIYGTQEQGLFGGTENVLGIAALGKAIELYQYDKINQISKLRDYMIAELMKIDGCEINGSLTNRLPGNVNFRIDGVQFSPTLFDLQGIQLSSASACHSFSQKPSHVLKEIGLTDEQAIGSIRVSLNEENTKEEVDYFLQVVKFIVDTKKTDKSTIPNSKITRLIQQPEAERYSTRQSL